MLFAKPACWVDASDGSRHLGSTHRFKHRLALVVAGKCVLRYDNETGKGDHRHAGDAETLYSFSSHERLLADFWADVDAWRQRR